MIEVEIYGVIKMGKAYEEFQKYKEEVQKISENAVRDSPIIKEFRKKVQEIKSTMVENQ